MLRPQTPAGNPTGDMQGSGWDLQAWEWPLAFGTYHANESENDFKSYPLGCFQHSWMMEHFDTVGLFHKFHMVIDQSVQETWLFHSAYAPPIV